MSISRRHVLGSAGALAAAATIGVAGCGSNTGRGSSESSSAGTGGKSGSKPHLTQWYHEYGEKGVHKAVKRYAADYDDAEISVQWNPGDYNKLLSAALLTKKRPDIFEAENGPTLDMIKAHQVTDVGDVFGDAKGDFPDSILKPMTWDKKIWAVPQTVDMQMLFYRKSVLDKAKVKPPKTFEELVDAAKAAKSTDMKGFFASNAVGADILGNLLIWSSGRDLTNANDDAPGFDPDTLATALRKYRDLVASGAVLQSASQDWSAPDAFTNGEAAMVWSGLWNVPEYEKKLKDDFGVVPFPALGSNGKQAVPVGAFSESVAAKGKDPEAAKKFVKWLWVDNTSDQLDFSTAYGYHIPARSSLAKKAKDLQSGVGADAVRFVADHGQAPAKSWTTAAGDALQGAITKVVKQKADPTKQADAVVKKAKSEIKRAVS